MDLIKVYLAYIICQLVTEAWFAINSYNGMEYEFSIQLTGPFMRAGNESV